MSSVVQVNPQVPTPPSTPPYILFDANAVGTAAFFGSPIMGTWLMALNYRRLGDPSRAATALIAGISVTALVIILGWNLPNAASMPIALALFFATRWSAQSLQGAAVKDHVERGGRLGSRWTAFWLSIGFLAVMFVVLFAYIYLSNQHPGVMIGAKDEVFYSGSATKDDARALGNGLKALGFFTDKGANVFVDKGKDGTVISFVVKDGIWDDPSMVANFEAIARQEAATVGGLPITLRLINSSLDVKKSERIN